MSKKVVLAYSGGLDTSVILGWLQKELGYEVVTFTANLGQSDDFEAIASRARSFGVKEVFIEDLRKEFVQDYIFPMFRGNAVYESYYLLGTAIARPLIAKRQVEIARITGASAVAHGATGKGNDQVRFEMGYYGIDPSINVIAPWRIWNLDSRKSLIEYAQKIGMNLPFSASDPPYSMDANILHISYEGKALEDPVIAADYAAMKMETVLPENATDNPELVSIEFEEGNPIAINGSKLDPVSLFELLNQKGRTHGVGIIDIVENRYVGIKSRGVYETPGGTILLMARRALESITLDRGAYALKDSIVTKYAELIYNGYWYSAEREMIQALIDNSQKHVTGTVLVKLYKGSVSVVSREAPGHSLYNKGLVSFDEDGGYSQSDATGFIRLNSLRFRNIRH